MIHFYLLVVNLLNLGYEFGVICHVFPGTFSIPDQRMHVVDPKSVSMLAYLQRNRLLFVIRS